MKGHRLGPAIGLVCLGLPIVLAFFWWQMALGLACLVAMVGTVIIGRRPAVSRSCGPHGCTCAQGVGLRQCGCCGCPTAVRPNPTRASGP